LGDLLKDIPDPSRNTGVALFPYHLIEDLVLVEIRGPTSYLTSHQRDVVLPAEVEVDLFFCILKVADTGQWNLRRDDNHGLHFHPGQSMKNQHRLLVR